MNSLPIVGNVFVACADVLGFKNLISTRPLMDLVQAVGQYVGSNEAAGMLHFAAGKTFLPGQEVDDGFRMGAKVDYVVFSDSTFLWTLDDSENSLEAILKASALVIAGGLSNPFVPLPFRIGIARGEVHIEKGRNIYLGPAIVAAHEAEEAQDWVGGALDSSLDAAYQSLAKRPTVLPKAVLFDVPVHPDRAGSEEASMQMHAINWPIAIGDPQYVETQLTGLATSAGPKHRHKYERALAFYRRYAQK